MVGVAHEQAGEFRRRLAATTVRQIAGDRVGCRVETRETFRMRAHEVQNALDALRFPARRNVDEHQGRVQASLRFALGQQAQQAAHRGADQDRLPRLRLREAHDIVDELFHRVGLVRGIPIAFAMSAPIEREPAVARGGEARRARAPSLTCLAEAMEVEQVARLTPPIARQAAAIRSREAF